MNNKLTSAVHYDSPSNPEKWNHLAGINSNLQQSTYVDHSQAFFRQRPVYIEIWADEMLVGGLKFYVYKSSRPLIKSLNSNILQSGEMLINPEFQEDDTIREHCLKDLKKFISGQKVVFSKHSMHYGYSTKMPEFDFFQLESRNDYFIGHLALDRSSDELWKGLHQNRRRNITEAGKLNYSFYEGSDFELFAQLLLATYSGQEKLPPSIPYLKLVWEDLSSSGIMKLYFVRDDKQALAAAMVSVFGTTAYYNFGGMLPGSGVAGSWLHWNIALFAREQGCKTYCFGQLASGEDQSNSKFTHGITSFKRRFGLTELPAFSVTFVHQPFRYALWKNLKKLTGIK